MSINRNILVSAISLCVHVVFGQGYLQKLVTLDYQNEKAVVVFKEIQKQTGVVFSYGSFDDKERMNIKVKEVSLKNVIPILESELKVQVFLNEKYLIIKPVKIDDEHKDVILNGSVSDLENGVTLSSVSVYVKEKKLLVNSDESGRFSIKIPKDSKKVAIHLAKTGFIDTSIVIIASKDHNLHVAMRNYPRTLVKEFEELSQNKIIPVGSEKEQLEFQPPKEISPTYLDKFWAEKSKQFENLSNITDTILSKFSLSLLPPVSTNRLLSFNTVNTLSVNIIGGHSKGLKGVEVGGVYNFDAGDVYGVQAGGVLNLVKEKVSGVQIAGISNGVRRKVTGLQAAGVNNYVSDDIAGVQVAGVMQNARQVYGVQVAGVLNVAKKFSGGQIGGVINIADTTSHGLQIAGVINRAKNFDGLQISGVLNTCDTLRGLQIGLINKSNTIKKGFSLGLFNYVKNGYNKIEIARNDLGIYSLGYRSGWAPLHMFYYGGVNIHNSDNQYLVTGVGLGSSIAINKNWSFELDATTGNTQSINDLAGWDFNMLSKALLGVAWRPVKRFGIRTGLSVNHFWYNPSGNINGIIAGNIKNGIYTYESLTKSHKMWIGWQVGILF